MGKIKKIVNGVVVEVDETQMVKTIENGVVVERPLGQAVKKKVSLADVGVRAKTSSDVSTSSPQSVSEESKIKTLLKTVKSSPKTQADVDRNKKWEQTITPELEISEAEFDEDPVATANRIILNKTPQIKRTDVNVSSTAVPVPIEKQIADKQTAPSLEEQGKLTRKDASNKMQEVRNYFSNSTVNSLEHIIKLTGINNNDELYSDEADERIQSSLRPGNETDRLAYQRLQDAKNARKSIAENVQSGKGLDEMAVDFAERTDPDMASKIKELRSTPNAAELFQGITQVDRPASQAFGNATMGRMMFNFLNNSAVAEEVEKVPGLTNQYRSEISQLIDKYPEFGKMYLGQRISQKLEEMGVNNAILNVVTKDERDKAVEALKKEGQLTENEERFYNENIRPLSGLGLLGRKVTGNPIIDTPGALENTASGAYQGFKAIPKGIYELSGLKDDILGSQGALKKDLESTNRQIGIKPKGLVHEIVMNGGQFLGQSLSIGSGGNLLNTLKVVKNPKNAMAVIGGVQAYANYMPIARQEFPGDELKQRGFATILAGLEMATENIFNDKKVVDGLLGKLKPGVAETIKDFTSKKISAEAARENIQGLIKRTLQDVPDAAKYFSKAVGQNTIEEMAAELGQQVTEGVFTNKPFEDWVDGDDLWNTARQAALGSGFIAGLSTRADMQRNRGITAKNIYDIAQDPDYWKEQVLEGAKVDEDLAVEAEDKIKNIDLAASVLQQLEGTDLTEKQKVKFLITELEKQVKTEQAQPQAAPIITQNEIAKLEQVQTDLLNGNDDGSIEGDVSDNLLPEEQELLTKIKENSGSTLQNQDISYFQDKAAEDPAAFMEIHGKKITKQLLERTSTEKLIENRDYLLNNFGESESTEFLNQIISQRENEDQAAEPTTEIVEEKIIEQPETVIDEATIKEGAETTEPVTTEESLVTETEPIADSSTTEEGATTPPPIEEVKSGVYSEMPKFQLLKRELRKVRERMGMDEYEGEVVSDLEAITKAQNTIDEWKEKGEYAKGIDKIIKDAFENKISDAGQNILAQHIADLTATMNSTDRYSEEYNKLSRELNRATEAGDNIRSEAGRTLGRNRLAVTPKTFDTVLDIEMDMMEDYGVDELTDEQKREAEKRFNDIQAKFEKERELKEKAEAEVERLKAENEILKAKKKTATNKKKTNEEYKQERKDILNKIKDKWNKASNDGTLSSDIPFRKQFAAIAPDVAKLVRSYLEQGVAKTLEEVRNLLRKDIQGAGIDISEDDTRRLLAGEYDERKPTKNELSNAVRVLREEERLLLELERLEATGEPKDSKKAVVRNQQLKSIRDKIKEFYRKNKLGQYSDESKFETAVKQQITNNNKKREEFEKRIKEEDFEDEKDRVSILDNDEFRKKNPKLYNEYLKSVTEKQKALVAYETKRLDDQIKNYSKLEKFGFGVDTLINTSKGAVAMFDQSGVFVQMLPATLAHPWVTLRNLPSALRDLVSPKWFDARMAKMKNSKKWDVLQKMGVAFYDPDAISDDVRNELLGGRKNLLNKDIKLGGKKFSIGKAFERSTANLFNNMRLYLAEAQMEHLYSQGKTVEKNLKEFEDAGRVINELTGHGKVQKHIAAASPVVNKIIWSPKMISSTLNLLAVGDILRPKGIASAFGLTKGDKDISKGFYSGLTPQQRLFAIKQLGRAFGTLSAIYLSALALKAIRNGEEDDDEEREIDLRPSSVGFGDIKVGNKTINPLGRFGKAVRIGTQVFGGKRKLGEKTDELGESASDKSQWDVFFSGYGRGAATPFAGYTFDMLFNKRKNYFTKEKYTVGSSAKSLFVPLSFQDAVKDFTRDGTVTAAATTLGKVYGLNIRDVRDFQSNDGKLNLKYKDKSGKYVNRETTPDEYTQYKLVKEELYQKELIQYQTQKPVYIDRYGEISLTRDVKGKKVKYDSLDDEQKKTFENKIKAKAGDEAKDELLKSLK